MPRQPNQINSDIYPGENIDVIFDACKKWPFADNSIALVRSSHVLEHLLDPWNFFREAFRVLAPSDQPNLQLRLPYGASGDGIGDLTHVRQWIPGSFCCFQPGYGASVYNMQHDSWDAPFSVMSIYQRVNPELRWLLKPVIRRWGVPLLRFLWGGYQELIVGMRALKKPDEIIKWKILYRANSVPVAHVIYQHEYEGRELGEHEKMRLRFFGEGAKELQALSDAQGA